MSIDLLLAICVVILAAGLVIVTHMTITHLHGEIRKYKFLYESIEDEAREWEKKALAYSVESTELATKLEDTDDKLKPIRENEDVAYDFDLEVVGQGDPLWELVRECRDLMPLWELRRPEIACQLPHRRYSEFAQFIANLSPGEQNREKIGLAIQRQEVPS